MADLRVRDVPKWEHRLYLRCKHLPWALFMLVALVLTAPLLLVLGLFSPEAVQEGIANVTTMLQERARRVQQDFRRFGAKPKE